MRGKKYAIMDDDDLYDHIIEERPLVVREIKRKVLADIVKTIGVGNMTERKIKNLHGEVEGTRNLFLRVISNPSVFITLLLGVVFILGKLAE